MAEWVRKKSSIVSCLQDNRNLKYIDEKRIDLKGERDSSTVIVRDTDSPFLTMDRTSRQMISKKRADLNNTIQQRDLTDICRILYPIVTKYTFFSYANGTFSRVDKILEHKASLSKF